MKNFKKIINKLSGTTLLIDVKDEYLDIVKDNKKILLQAEIEDTSHKIISRKSISFKKLKKKINNHDNLIFHINIPNNFISNMIKESIYIIDKKIVIYSDYEIDIIHRYKRVNAIIKEYHDTIYVYEIDLTNKKINKLKNKLYGIIDIIENFINFIANILIG